MVPYSMSRYLRKSETNQIPKDWQASVVQILSNYPNQPTVRIYNCNVDNNIFPTREDLFDSLITFFINSRMAKLERKDIRFPNMKTFSFHFDSLVLKSVVGQVSVRDIYGKVSYDPDSRSVSIWSAHSDSLTRPPFFFKNWIPPKKRK